MHLPTTIVIVFLVGLIAVAKCDNESEPVKNETITNSTKKLYTKECSTGYSITCLKLDVVRFVERLSENKEDINLLPGVSVIRENTVEEKHSEVLAELAREFPDDPEARLDGYVLKKITSYLGSHSIKLNLFDAQEAVSGRKGGYGGGGGGGKKKGGYGAILAMGAMMKGTLMALALGALAALAGKALMTALISLLLSAIIGLKSLKGGSGQTTYEVVAKPVYSTHHTHHEEHQGHGYGGGHSSYKRSMDIVLPPGLQPDYKPY